jgi:predicted 3-demethylubiquinone-9 3-methyltransferase (glyoxalase superfamily)
MSKISPCLWFQGEAEAAAKFYVSLLPGSQIQSVMTNPIDTPSGPAGSVLLVDFTLAGQTFQALNGGIKMEYTHAISLSIDCADQAEVDRLWEGLLEGGAEEQCGWLQDRYGVRWQVVPSALPRLLSQGTPAQKSAVMAAMMDMIKLDVATLQAAFDAA